MDDFHCSFCGKGRLEVRKLISGPRVFICDECVAACRNLVGPPTGHAEAALADLVEYVPSLAERQALNAESASPLSDSYGVPFSDLDALTIPNDVLRQVSTTVAREHNVIPIAMTETRLTIAMQNPLDRNAIACVMEAAPFPFEESDVAVSTRSAVLRALERYYPLPPKGANPILDDRLRCSFCGKGQSDVARLIAAPTHTMCDECLGLCEDIIAEE